MPLKPVKCTHCDANLEVTETKQTYFQMRGWGVDSPALLILFEI